MQIVDPEQVIRLIEQVTAAVILPRFQALGPGQVREKNPGDLVTVRGKEAAVILAPEEYERLLPKTKGHQPLVRFLQGLGLDGIKFALEKDIGREIDL